MARAEPARLLLAWPQPPTPACRHGRAPSRTVSPSPSVSRHADQPGAHLRLPPAFSEGSAEPSVSHPAVSPVQLITRAINQRDKEIVSAKSSVQSAERGGGGGGQLMAAAEVHSGTQSHATGDALSSLPGLQPQPHGTHTPEGPRSPPWQLPRPRSPQLCPCPSCSPGDPPPSSWHRGLLNRSGVVLFHPPLSHSSLAGSAAERWEANECETRAGK